MQFKLPKLMCFIGLSMSAVAQANQTPANDDGGGNVVFFDRHQLNCGYFGMSSMRLFRPSGNQIAFDYQCREAGENSNFTRTTPANDDGVGNMVYLDRHGVDCFNKPIQFVQLYRPTGNTIGYHYKCGSIDLANVTDHYTPANDDGGGNSIFLDRHHMSCPDGQVMSYFRLFRPSGNTVSYHYKCGIPQTSLWQEIRMNGQCLDGSAVNHNDDVYLYPCHGGDNQKWQLDGQGLLRSKANPNLCVDMIGTLKFPYYVDDARLNYCDSTISTQRFTYTNNKLATSYYGATKYLTTRLFNNADIVYSDDTFLLLSDFSFNSGTTRYNVDPFNYLADTLQNDTIRQFAAGFQVDDLAVEQMDPMGTSIITGRIRSMSDSNPLGLAVKAGVNMRKYLLNDSREDVPFKITLTNQGGNNFEAKVRLELVRGWLEVNPQSPIGTQMKFKDADLVFTYSLNNGEESKTFGVEGSMYIKPTTYDSWLFANPSVTRDIGPDPTTSYGVFIKGACWNEPNQYTNGAADCNQDWNVLNAHILTAMSEANGGENFLQIDVVGSAVTGGKVIFAKGQFLSTANISGEWEGNEEGSQGKAHVQLNGLDQKLRETISESAFLNWTGGSTLLSGAYSIDEVFVSKTNTDPGSIHVKMHVLGEAVEAIYTPQSQAASYLQTAQANEDLLRAIANAIARVIKERSGLSTFIDLTDNALHVIGVRGGTKVAFNAAGQAVDAAGNILGPAGEFLGTIGGAVGDVFCSLGICW